MPEAGAERMVRFDLGSHRFQLRAAAVIVEDEHVLLHRMADESVWALPGGRVEAGESAAVTIMREMREETGESVSCGELLFVVENFFDHGGRAHHELGLYLQARLAPDARLRDRTRSHDGTEGGKRLEFRWFAIDALQVDLRPGFLRTALAKPSSALRHVIQGA